MRFMAKESTVVGERDLQIDSRANMNGCRFSICRYSQLSMIPVFWGKALYVYEIQTD